jgi:hypothetical protein
MNYEKRNNLSETTYLHLSASNDEETSEYECVFNEDILIKKDSKIGLQSVSINFNPNQIYIDNTNQLFNLAIGGSDSFGATNASQDAISLSGFLATGQYNAVNLLTELQYQLNRTNIYTTSVNFPRGPGRVEFVCNSSQNNKVSIQLARSAEDFNAPAIEFSTNGIQINVGAGNNKNSFSKLGTAVPTDHSYTIYNPFWIRSRGQYQIRFPVNKVGSIVGLVETIPDTSITSLDINGYYLAVKHNISGFYQLIYNGTTINTLVIPADNDLFKFYIGQGKYKIELVPQATGITQVLFETDYTRDTYKRFLHGGLSLLDPTATADSFAYTPSPFQLSTTEGLHEISDISEFTTPNYLNTTVGSPPGNPSRLTLSLSNGLRDVLGYSVNTFTSQKQTDSFDATTSLQLITFPNALYVELVNVPLNTFDSISRRRKNILAFIPGFEQTADTSNYYMVASEIVYINTKLFTDTLINSWRIRITDPSGQVLAIDPGKIAINVVVVC